jgi:hypothetical protein
VLRAKADFFERRGRKGFAECAEGGKRKPKEDKEEKYIEFYLKLQTAFSFLVLFLYFFFAPFAKPSRPLRSKKSPYFPHRKKYK